MFIDLAERAHDVAHVGSLSLERMISHLRKFFFQALEIQQNLARSATFDDFLGAESRFLPNFRGAVRLTSFWAYVTGMPIEFSIENIHFQK